MGCPRRPLPHAGDGPARLGPGLLGFDGLSRRWSPSLSLPTRRDLGFACDHQRTRFYLSKIHRRKSLPKELVHLLATDRWTCQHVRCLESSSLPRTSIANKHSTPCPDDSERSDLGRSGQEPCNSCSPRDRRSDRSIAIHVEAPPREKSQPRGTSDPAQSPRQTTNPLRLGSRFGLGTPEQRGKQA